MSSSKPRPNIVLMVSDDHGREALGCYGNAAIRTPNLDALAREGTRFTNAFCTTASCAASRSAILTGRHNHANGTYGHTHGRHHFSCFPDVRTLPAIMREAGYRTGRVGKQHYAPESQFPFDWGIPVLTYNRNDVGMSEACRSFVREDNPFFLYWCSLNPHRERRIESHPLQPNSFGNPTESFDGDAEERYAEDAVEVPSFLPDTPEVRAELAQYYQSIARLDRGIGRLIEVLKQEGKWENTVILYISDNGAAFPEAKTTLYEPGMQLPCIVRDPGVKKRGIACDGLITWTDIAPTVLDYAGATEDPGQFHGASFRRILESKSPDDWREEIFASHTFHEITNYYPMRVLRTQRYKFIYNIAWKLDYSFASDLWASASWQGALRDGRTHFGTRSIDAYVHRPRFELYDLEADPDELENLADRPEHRERVESFTEKLKAFQAETSDPWLHKWRYE